MFVPMSCASSLSSSLSSTRALQYKYKWPIHQWYNADLPAKDQCDETDTCDPDRFNAGFTVHADKCSSSGACRGTRPAGVRTG